MRQSSTRIVTIVTATNGHMDLITSIYEAEVLTGVSSWEEIPPDRQEMNERRKRIQELGYPYLVAYSGDDVLGYTYAAPYRPRTGYR